MLRRQGLAIWTRQLAGLVSSGLPLERALTALTDEADDERQRNLVAALRAEVNAGSPLRQGAGAHSRASSRAIYIAVIGAGEQSGNLGLVLERLADDLEERQALQRQADRRGAVSRPSSRWSPSPSCCSW